MKLSVDLTVADVERSAAFYRLLGLEVPELWRRDGVAHHVEIGPLMLNSRELTGSYHPATPAVILIVDAADRAAVDAKHAELVAAGYASLHEPFDAFWRARYAIVADPDGNHVGIMSPQDPEQEEDPTF
jgi:predicted enzyme related to lactoylglutathione lyase